MSLLKARELREKRAGLAKDAEQILEAARAEERDLTAEEQVRFDKLHEEVETLGRQARNIERQETLNAELQARLDEHGEEEREDRGGRPELTEERRWDAIRAWSLAEPELMEEHRDTLRAMGVRGNEVSLRTLTMSELHNFRREWRAQSVGTDSAGGYTVPQGFRPQLEDALLQFGAVRQSRATILRTASGNQMEIPTSNDTSNSGALLAENTQDSEQDITFGQEVLDAYKYTSKIIRVSKELLQDSAFDLPSFLGQKLGERLGRIHNTHFTTGTGSSQPEGIVVGAADSGVTAASSTVYTYAELVQIVHAVDPAYRRQAEWMFSDATLSMLKQMVDGNDHPLWVPGVASREPDMLLGYRYVINQDMADPATTAKSVLFGDMSKFFIRDVLDVTLVRMNERYADYHQVAWVAISRNDSVLVDAGTNPIVWADHT